MTNALVLGATGLCGSGFLKYAIAAPQLKKVFTITRSPIQESDSKLNSIVDKDSSNWSNIISGLDENIDVLFTALATTRAVGGTGYQYKIDHDLNVELAKAAREKGCSTIVIVTAHGAHADSRFFYTKMKGEIERDISDLGFNRTIILRPGILLGERHERLKGFGNGLAVKLGSLLYRTRLQSLGYPINGAEVGKVGVHLALQENTAAKKVEIVKADELLQLAASI
ncbi:hypothetical protein KAFR_0G02750 [Kazachstania africana CBS 2517]|uniref:Protein FMP52, mitochondrial n=1 Tax=Kazachstania africana (strain ATCC 22294 / BCRC 22015 / CBS 2517 / CECT 1963 / NBRC 1671 / NRRL Y-8276) TaxID=1071382 RepID=H2AY56_KAZAF|nr:hypothetical protein KAFR_0G02750 [Kazachstania africana CBS 2517]CCF59306.1 hypothetical protein KAFR_0G02750 [Kazachstania africana CBS 2517]